MLGLPSCLSKVIPSAATMLAGPLVHAEQQSGQCVLWSD